MGCWRARTTLGLTLRSKHILYVNHPARWKPFGLPFWEENYRCSLVWDSHTKPQRRKTYCCGLFLHTTCQTQGKKWLLVGPRGALAMFHVWGSDSRWCTHMHKKRNTRGTSKSHHQWYKLSAAVFRLRRALLMQCVPYNGTRFHFHPCMAAPAFCSSHLHHSLCTHNM